MQDVDVETTPRVTEAELFPPRDDEGDLNPAFVAAVAEAVEAHDGERVRALMADVHEADFGDLFEALDPEHRPRLIELLGRDFDFTALTEVDDAVREDILEELEPETVVEGVRDLDSDDAVLILEGLDEAEKTAILDQLPAVERVALQRSLDYPENTAGRRMQTEFIAVPPFWTVGQTIDDMRETEDLPDTFYEIFVVDPGVPPPRHRAARHAPALEAPRDDRRDHEPTIPTVVQRPDDQEEVARLFQRYNLVSAAVVDEANRLVGVIMVDDIVDVIEAEADADIKALGGVRPQRGTVRPASGISRAAASAGCSSTCSPRFLASSVLKGFEHRSRRWWRSPSWCRSWRARAATPAPKP